jgi:FkbM family methyltransferase
MAQKHGVLGSILFRIANYRRSFPVRLIARGCEGFLRCYHNVNYDASSNGEARVLQLLGARSPGCIFDVGANVGDWLLLAHRFCPRARLHAFEVVPETFRTLAQRAAAIPDAILNQTGLAERPGRIDVVHCPDDPGLSSVFAWPHGKPTTTISCEVVTGDDYCAAHAVDHIDFLKLDIEGAELPALQGFHRMLSDGRVDVIQFEYGYVNVMPGFLLKDLAGLLTSLDYVVGKIYPTHVDFKPYELKDEDFLGPNYLAVRRTCTDLVSLLA